MGEHSFENVTAELEGSGLLDLMYPQISDVAYVYGGDGRRVRRQRISGNAYPDRQEVGRLPSRNHDA